MPSLPTTSSQHGTAHLTADLSPHKAQQSKRQGHSEQYGNIENTPSTEEGCMTGGSAGPQSHYYGHESYGSGTRYQNTAYSPMQSPNAYT